MHGTSKPAPCFCFEGFMFIWFYVHIYIYIYICTSLLGEKIGWGFFKNPCRNQLLSNKIVIVELFFCGSIVFKENNGRFFQFFVVELLLDFWSNLSVFSLKWTVKVSSDKTREKTWKDHHSPPESLSSTSGPITDETRFEPPSPNPSWGPQLPQLSTSPSKMGKPPPRLLETDFWPFSYVHHFTCLHLHHCQYFTFSDGYASGREEETGKRRNAATENGGERGAVMRFGRLFFFRYVHSLTVRPWK